MRWLIEVAEEDKEKCYDSLEKFKVEFDAEWEKAIKALPDFLTGVIKQMRVIAMIIPDDKGWIIAIPIKTPLLAKMIGGWKKKSQKQIEGILKTDGIKVKNIKFIGD